MRVAWDASHGEFLISDHYYFYRLLKYARSCNIYIDEIYNLQKALDYDAIVFNYPEKFFDQEEVDAIKEFVKKGGRVILCGHFRNMDRIADSCNTLSTAFGVKFCGLEVRDKINNHDEDDLLLVTTRVYLDDVYKVLLPCSDLVVYDKSARVIAEPEATAQADVEGAFFVCVPYGKGEFIAGGCCIFWDNYSIDLYNNKDFALKILGGNLW